MSDRLSKTSTAADAPPQQFCWRLVAQVADHRAHDRPVHLLHVRPVVAIAAPRPGKGDGMFLAPLQQVVIDEFAPVVAVHAQQGERHHLADLAQRREHPLAGLVGHAAVLRASARAGRARRLSGSSSRAGHRVGDRTRPTAAPVSAWEDQPRHGCVVCDRRDGRMTLVRACASPRRGRGQHHLRAATPDGTSDRASAVLASHGHLRHPRCRGD